MAKITLYTIKGCPYCLKAKNLLSAKKAAFKEVDLTNNDALLEGLTLKTNWRTVPMVFFGEDFVGGFNELKSLDDAGELDAMLKS